jgi:hypothetical protein
MLRIFSAQLSGSKIFYLRRLFSPPSPSGIADFLLEFAILGHEALADVPNLIHPQASTAAVVDVILFHNAPPSHLSCCYA